MFWAQQQGVQTQAHLQLRSGGCQGLEAEVLLGMLVINFTREKWGSGMTPSELMETESWRAGSLPAPRIPQTEHIVRPQGQTFICLFVWQTKGPIRTNFMRQLLYPGHSAASHMLSLGFVPFVTNDGFVSSLHGCCQLPSLP